MHTYLRIVGAFSSDRDSAAEEQSLRNCLRSAPGIKTLNHLKAHPKGGYSIALVFMDGDSEALLSHLSSHGYHVVI